MSTDLMDLDFNIKIDDGPKGNDNISGRSTATGLDSFFDEPKKGKNEASPLISNNYANEYQQKAAFLQSQFNIAGAAHPTACIFTCLFKGIALFGYLFMGLILNDITIFILAVLMAAFDFWTVKNVTGRLLVGLRWWTKIKEDGSEEWIFESRNEKIETNVIDSRFFWWSQIGALAMWSIISIFCIFGLKFFWGACCGINWSLLAVNLWAYYKCSKDYDKKVNDLMNQAGMSVASGLLKNAGGSIATNLLGRFFG